MRALIVVVAISLAGFPGPVAAGTTFTPGAPGIGDPYYPLDGNGGYDVRHYDLELAYDPPTDLLTGRATVRAVATQDLSRFDLDFDGLTVRSITVNDRAATWTRDEGELVVTPATGLPNGRRFIVVVAYDGIPEPIPTLFGPGLVHTDDGLLVLGQPQGASTWYPVNDHPRDKASYTFRITVPAGLEAVANGSLVGSATRGGRTTWTWDAPEPMASYLSMMQVGEFEIRTYTRDRVRYWDAIDSDFSKPLAYPRTGSRYAWSQGGDGAYKRLATTIAVPAGGATLSFWVARRTERDFDFLAVEAHHPGLDDWTTLPDANGHTTGDPAGICYQYQFVHPFLAHYMAWDETDPENPTCTPTGTTGAWYGASGTSAGYEHWTIDLAPYAGGEVEVAIAYITDVSYSLDGVVIDDVVVSTGAGSTGFESGKLRPWSTPPAPDGSPGNATDWTVAVAGDLPVFADRIRDALDHQPEMLRVLGKYFGPYPFEAGGAIVDDLRLPPLALETQTRPIYAYGVFRFPGLDQVLMFHELAHQWFGDSVALGRWQDIWLNEGFAQYAEWLWMERQGWVTPQEIYDGAIQSPDDPIWELAIGDPGPDHLFDDPVYFRGALTLQALRIRVGDRTFFEILQAWAAGRGGGNGTTPDFIALAERISRQDLGALFDAWLSAGYPLGGAGGTAPTPSAATWRHPGLPAKALTDPTLRRFLIGSLRAWDARSGH